MPVLSRGLLTALAGLALAAPLAGTGAGGSACALADDLLGSSVADFEYGIGGWSAGNSSRWAWQTGCDGTAGPPCAAAGRGYLLAVGEGAQLTSPPVLGYCVSLSYFAQGVEIAVEAVNEAGEATTLATLPQSKGWRVSTSLALPASYARVRLTARAAAGGRWVAQSVGGVDDIGFRLRANPLNDPAALKLPAAFGVPLRPRAVLSPIGVDVSTTFALSPLGLGALPALLSARGIWRAKVFQYEPGLLSALAQGGVREAVVGIPNVELRNLAFSPSHAEKLVGSMEGHRELISLVVVGNEPLASWWAGEFEPLLPLALEHVRLALQRRGWHARATVSLQADVLIDTWPPSDARVDPLHASLIASVLPALMADGAPLLMNLYPFLAWRAAEGQLGLGFATMEGGGCERTKDGSCYANLFDAMLDALTHALGKEGLSRLPVIVGEVGWPTGGNEPGADAHAACIFTNSLVSHAAFASTPLGLKIPPLFAFELLDETEKSAGVATLGASERHYGLLTEAGEAKFKIDWTPASALSVRAALQECPARVLCGASSECVQVVGRGSRDAQARDAKAADAGLLAKATGLALRQACFEQHSSFCLPAPNATEMDLASALGWLCAPAGVLPSVGAERGLRESHPETGSSSAGGSGGGGGVDCAVLAPAPSEGEVGGCAAASLRARVLWAATSYAREHGAHACDFRGTFAWGPAVPPGLELGACPLGVCEDSAPSAPPSATRGHGAAGDACLVAADCGQPSGKLRSFSAGPLCEPRPLASSASGSCRPKEHASQLEMTRAINWACSEGGVDCTAVRTLCASASLRERAAWVFSLYASTKGEGASCSFAGIAELSVEPLAEAAPSCNIGVCRFPSEDLWRSPLFGGLLLLLAACYATMRVRAAFQIRAEWNEALRRDDDKEALPPAAPPFAMEELAEAAGGEGAVDGSRKARKSGQPAAPSAAPLATPTATPTASGSEQQGLGEVELELNWRGKAASMQML